MDSPAETEILTDISRQTPKAYLWEVPGKPTSIYLDYDVVDLLLQEVLRSFGAVPRRGVEVGGLLLGSIEPGEKTVVHIQDFEPVPCQHARGPSYLLSDKDLRRLEEAVTQWKPAPGRRIYAVGFFRSHTREGLGLSPDDIEFYNKYFPDLGQVVLLVKPFATRVSVGGFFFREQGELHSESSYQEFPFRRRELGGEVATPEPELISDEMPDGGQTAQSEQETPPDPGRPSEGTRAPRPTGVSAPYLSVERPAAGDSAGGRKLRSGWVWIPLSFIFLLLGIVLGFQVAISVRSQNPEKSQGDPYALGLSVRLSGESLHVRWDRKAPAVRNARGGALVIVDGGYQKTVNLDAGQLQNGSVIYRRASNDVRFRLEVLATDRSSVTESIQFPVDPSSTPATVSQK